MSVISARLPDRGAPGLAAAIVGLGLFGILCGIGIAIGELQALIASLTVLAFVAVLVDYRIGAVLLIVMQPVEGSHLFPHSVFGLTGLNPLNLVLAATLISYLLRGYEVKRFLPKPLLLLFLLPIVIAGLIGMRHVHEIHPVFYEEEVLHYTDAMGYLRDSEVLNGLVFLVRLAHGRTSGRPKSRAFVEFVFAQFPEKESPVLAPQEAGSRIILP